MSFATPLINAVGEDCYHLPRTLGDRNAVTQWPEESYAGDYDVDDFLDTDFVGADEIKIIMNLTQVSDTYVSAGDVAVEKQAGYIAGDSGVNQGDKIEYHDTLYDVESIEVPEYHLGEIGYKKITMIRKSE